jgi:actin-related protein 10
MWELDLENLEGCHGDRREAGRLIGVRIVKKMRDTFYKSVSSLRRLSSTRLTGVLRHLLADPKSRKVIVLENNYMPSFVKEYIAQALFDNLRVS